VNIRVTLSLHDPEPLYLFVIDSDCEENEKER